MSIGTWSRGKRGPQRRYNPNESSSHAETVSKPNITSPVPYRCQKYIDNCKRKSEAVTAWEKTLSCVCGSGLLVMYRSKRSGIWQGYCKKCKPERTIA